MPKLYYVDAMAGDSEQSSLSLFVFAESTENALALWVEHYELEESEVQDATVWQVPVIGAGETEQRAIPWDEVLKVHPKE